jgi:hypothetical protein
MIRQIAHFRPCTWLQGLVVGAFLLVLAEHSALADGFRCKKTDKLVNTGDSMAQVQSKCGPPTQREDIIANDCTDLTCYPYKSGERWFYDFGHYDLIRILLFKFGILQQVDYGMYGD